MARKRDKAKGERIRKAGKAGRDRRTRSITRSDFEKKPYLAWNAFIDILANAELDELGTAQRIPHLVWLYDAEVQNGGHCQYFENVGTIHLEETLKALDGIGAKAQRKLLARAKKRLGKAHLGATTADEFVAEALEGTFDADDTEYCQCKPTMNDYLKKYLDAHFDEFIELV